MANSSSNFIKINNEYVKFYATTNSALPEILKNTGALIVVQDNSKVDENGSYIRSLWLANNFIAEGHGFSATEMRDFYDSYAAIEDNGERQLTNIIERLKFGIDENATNMQRYVLSQGGDISNTIISAYIFGSSDRQDIQAAYLTNILKPADYEDNYIHNVESFIEYNYYDTYDNGEYVKTSHVAYATNIDKLNFNDKKITRDIIYDIPRGAEIQNAYISLETINNSCNGFTANVLSDDTQVIPVTETATFFTYIDTTGNDYRHVYDETSAMALKDTLYFQAHSYGTVNFKVYPNLPSEIEYISYENAIPEYTTTLGYVYCNIYDTIKYGHIDDITGTIEASSIYGDGTIARIYDTDNRYSYAVLDELQDSTYLTFAVPTNYEIVNVYQRRQYVANNRISYYEYNVTGDVYELSYDDTIYSSIKSLISMLKNEQVYVDSKNYVLKNNINENDSVIVTLLKNDNEAIETTNIINDFNSNNYNAEITAYFVQDSEYNSTHWFAPIELSYIQNTI